MWHNRRDQDCRVLGWSKYLKLSFLSLQDYIFLPKSSFSTLSLWILVAIMNQIWQKRFELMSRLMIFPTFHHHKCLQKNRSVQHVVLVNLQGKCPNTHDGCRGTMMRLKMPIVTWARGEDPKQLQAIEYVWFFGFSFFVCDPTLSAVVWCAMGPATNMYYSYIFALGGVVCPVLLPPFMACHLLQAGQAHAKAMRRQMWLVGGFDLPHVGLKIKNS